MSEIANSEGASEPEKPVPTDVVQFPPFPDPKDEDFDDDIAEDERNYYKTVFKDLNIIKGMRLHCTACDRHMGCSARNEVRMRAHPMLRTLVCHNCHIFYNSGEFEKGDDGSELYCRWCGQGGQVYCCSDCPHVFCAKCIKRNLGVPKIKEIENTDDWKCFKCNTRCLWDLRALCWAVLRYCDLKNKITYQTQDPQLKEAFKKDCSIDYSECCKNKTNRRIQKIETKKKEIKKEADAKSTANIISKIPSTIQVKKFATMEDTVKPEKKPQKRSSSPKNKAVLVKNPMTIASCTKVMNPIGVPPLAKKMRLPNPTAYNGPVQLISDRKPMATYTRIRPKLHQLPMPIANSSFNGFSANIFNNIPTDNINLSIESLTQGLDMSAVATVSQNSQDDDVVCTPDFPLEPLCEVTEDNDDDVQCITPAPVVTPKLVNPPPLVPRSVNCLTPDVSSDHIIQMTDNDVTVNAATGGLKFRVDPQTLSSNKMYRLPDGRIFAINANPNMPGGYSATIVAVTEPNTAKPAPKGATYAAKLSAVSSVSPTPNPKSNRKTPRILKRSTPKPVKITRSTETSSRECDLNVPVEWYRYNLIDAVDALEYALSRLHKLKKETTTVYLRSRTVNEMRNLHRTLDRLLNTSASRFGEIRDNLNKGFKQYVSKKSGGNISEDDDDVEILPDMEDNDDPIFIDENSVESTMNGSENQEVDLTGAGSSEHNDSGENTKGNHFNKSNADLLNVSENDNSEHGDVIAVISRNYNFEDSINQLSGKDCNKADNIKENDTENKTKVNENAIFIKEMTNQNYVPDNITDNSSKENENQVKEIENESQAKGIENESRVSEIENESQVKEIENESRVSETEIDCNVKKESDESVQENKRNDDVTSPCKQLKNKEVNGEMVDTAIDAEHKSDSVKGKECTVPKRIIDKVDSEDSDDKSQDTEMSEDMIEKLLKDESTADESKNRTDVSEALQEI